METGLFILAIIWIGLASFVGKLGKDKKIGQTTAFLVSFLFSPIIGLLAVIASDKVDKDEIENEPQKMPILEINSAAYRKATVMCNEAQELAASGDIDTAITKLEEAFVVMSRHPRVNYNLACLYSRNEDVSNSLKHLKFAIRNGYNKFDTIKTDTDLIFLREQDEYKAFANSGFDTNTKSVNVIPPKANVNKYELLDKINKLKKDGALSQEEFEKEKVKIMSMS